MDATHFDSVAKFFAARRRSRRQAGAGLAAIAAAGLAPGDRPRPGGDARPGCGGRARRSTFLFVQSFQSGSVAPRTAPRAATP